MKRHISNIIWLSLPLALVVGCAENHRDASVSYSPALSDSFTPTGDRIDSRMYSQQPMSPEVTTVPNGAGPEDWKLAQEIQSLLMSDRTLAKAPMAAVVNNGVVTLKGSFRNEKERERIRDEIARLPGVQRVDDQLEHKNPLGIGAGESKSY